VKIAAVAGMLPAFASVWWVMSTEPRTTLELPPQTAPGDLDRRRGLLFLAMASAGMGFAMFIQAALNSNFVADVMQLGGHQQGVLEAFRESCGIIALGVFALLAGMAEPLLAAAALMVFGAGLASLAMVPDFWWLVVVSMVWSQGLHVWMPLPQSMTLALAEPGRAGRRLGQIHAAMAVGSGAGLLVAWILSVLRVPIRPIFVLAGAGAMFAACACLGIPRRIKTPGPRLVFRRRYGLYYLLCFLEGWRKQITIAFAGYLLVRVYHTPVETMLVLWMVIQAIAWFVSPLVGRLIDRVGERRVMTAYFAALVAVFIAYATVRSRYVLYAVFVLDFSFFAFAIALTTYLNRIVPRHEHTPTLGMGVAFNHVAAVSMPLLGALLWKYVDYRWVFYVGAASAAVSVIPAMYLPSRAARLPADSPERTPPEAPG